MLYPLLDIPRRPGFLDFQEFHAGILICPTLPGPQTHMLDTQAHISKLHPGSPTNSLPLTWGYTPSSVTCLQEDRHGKGLMEALRQAQGSLGKTFQGPRFLKCSLESGLYARWEYPFGLMVSPLEGRGAATGRLVWGPLKCTTQGRTSPAQTKGQYRQ